MSRVRAKGKKPIIGLTGGIGAGKSSVAGVFESLGAAVIDADRLGHEELRNDEVVATLRRWWGEAVCLAGGIPDRRAIAAIVFDNPAELKRLEDLLYPRIQHRREMLVAVYNADPAVRAIVLDAPKLCEAGLDEQCDAVVFVDVEWSVRVQRVAAARGWTEEEIRRREKMQIPLDTKRANADHVVVNHSSINELRPRIERVFSSVLAAHS